MREVDLLEPGERVGRAVVVSVVCHAALFSGSILWSAFHMPISLGNPDGAIGGAVPVTPIQGVPLTGSQSRVENPVANPVQHDVPAAIVEKPPPPPPPPDDAVEIEKQRKRVYAQRFSTRKKKAAPNQVPSSSGARVNSPLLSGRPSPGAGVGFGRGQPLRLAIRMVRRRASAPHRRGMAENVGAGKRKRAAARGRFVSHLPQRPHRQRSRGPDKRQPLDGLFFVSGGTQLQSRPAAAAGAGQKLNHG